jgi:hypothetical protein
VNFTYKSISKVTGLDAKIIRMHSFAVLHDESSSPDKVSHVHLLISNVISDSFQKKITQRVATQAVKNALNIAIKHTVGEDHNRYTPTRRQRYNKPTWAIRSEKNVQVENKLRELKSSYELVINSIKDWTTHFLLSLTRQSAAHADVVSKNLDYINTLSREAEKAFEPAIQAVEEQNKSMPDKSKISPQRKRRRRKR